MPWAINRGKQTDPDHVSWTEWGGRSRDQGGWAEQGAASSPQRVLWHQLAEMPCRNSASDACWPPASLPAQDPMVRSCVLSVVDEAAAAELVGELQAARQRLAAAVQVRWVGLAAEGCCGLLDAGHAMPATQPPHVPVSPCRSGLREACR